MHFHIQTTITDNCHLQGGISPVCLEGTRSVCRDRLMDAVGEHRLGHQERGRYTGKPVKLTSDAYQIAPSGCIVTLVERPGGACI